MTNPSLRFSLSCGLLLLSACSPSAPVEDDIDNGGWSSQTTRQESSIEAGERRAAQAGIRLELEGGTELEPQEGDPAMLRIPGSSAAATSKTATSEAASVATPVRTILISVTDGSFTPSAISAKKGERVLLQLIGGEGAHSFAIPELDMNVRVDAGQSVIVDLPTDKVGTFGFLCMVPCGVGHTEMKGTLTVQ